MCTMVLISLGQTWEECWSKSGTDPEVTRPLGNKIIIIPEGLLCYFVAAKINRILMAISKVDKFLVLYKLSWTKTQLVAEFFYLYRNICILKCFNVFDCWPPWGHWIWWEKWHKMLTIKVLELQVFRSLQDHIILGTSVDLPSFSRDCCILVQGKKKEYGWTHTLLVKQTAGRNLKTWSDTVCNSTAKHIVTWDLWKHSFYLFFRFVKTACWVFWFPFCQQFDLFYRFL